MQYELIILETYLNLCKKCFTSFFLPAIYQGFYALTKTPRWCSNLSGTLVLLGVAVLITKFEKDVKSGFKSKCLRLISSCSLVISIQGFKHRAMVFQRSLPVSCKNNWVKCNAQRKQPKLTAHQVLFTTCAGIIEFPLFSSCSLRSLECWLQSWYCSSDGCASLSDTQITSKHHVKWKGLEQHEKYTFCYQK